MKKARDCIQPPSRYTITLNPVQGRETKSSSKKKKKQLMKSRPPILIMVFKRGKGSCQTNLFSDSYAKRRARKKEREDREESKQFG